MAGGEFHCKDCCIYFDSARSLEVHLQYHQSNLMSMWMSSDERSREGLPVSSASSQSEDKMSQVNSNNESAPTTTDSCSTIRERYREPTPPFIGPPPISPMDFTPDFIKVEPGLQSPPTDIMSQTQIPCSGSLTNFSQQSPGSYYSDYTQQLVQQPQQSPYGNFQGVYNMNGGSCDDQFYGRGNSNMPRFHPYIIGRSPVPTPSPGATSMQDMKEENRSAPNTPEIYDLDSHTVLNNPSQQSQMVPLPPMWRPHEQFPSPNGNSHAPGTILQSPYASLGPSAMGMMGGMQQSFSGGHPLPVPHQGQSSTSLPTPSPNYPTSPALSPFYNHQPPLKVPGNITSTSTVTPFGGGSAIVRPTARDPPPPTEYPSNVKRAKSFKCEDCNKWFTSHGHLKRHYNTTLHKNMTKLNSNQAAPPACQPTVPDITRPPILSPATKSADDASTTSSHDDESNLSSSDQTETSTGNHFQTIGSAFQPPSLNTSSYPLPNSVYQSHPPVSIGHSQNLNPTLPHYNQNPHFLSEQPPLTAPTMYHGHFSTNPTFAPSFPHHNHTGVGAPLGAPFFPNTHNYMHAHSGGQQGPGFHSLNDFSGPTTVDGFSSLKLGSTDKTFPSSISPNHNNNNMPHAVPQFHDSSLPATSPEPVGGDTGSEASIESSDSLSCSSTPTPDTSFRCQDCPKTFNRMCYLTQHRSTYHEGEKPFKCGTCGKRFTEEVTFLDHQSKHAGEKPYKCEVCPKQFNHKTDLRRHMCLHTGDKPFACEQCGKGFIRKDHMLKHFQTHRKKAMAAAANATTPSGSHAPLPPNRPHIGFTAPHGLSRQHSQIPHPVAHASHSRPPHVVAAPVY